MKSNVSKNAKTDRKKNAKLRFNGVEIEPVLVYGHAQGFGKKLGVMVSSSKELLRDGTGNFVLWNDISYNVDEKKSS